MKADDRMAILTPVIKSYATGKGFACDSEALQLHGGAGYTRELGMEQFLRDSRIAMIYEGTNGVQALDLVGRKLAANGGRAVFAFFAEIEEYQSSLEGKPGMAAYAAGLKTVTEQLREATMWLMQNGMSNFDNAGASSHDYLNIFALAALAQVWAKMAEASLGKEADAFYASKLATANYFFARVLPDAAAHLVKVKTGADTVMALPADAF